MLLAGVLTLVVSLHEAAEGLVRPAEKSKRRPHIVMIVADDLGWDDVGYHGSKQVSTPNIDSLARNGVMLDNYYVQPVCTPTRSALMTGRYPIHNGMQKGVILASRAWGLGLNETLLPRHLKELGYRTHAIGKWHLGFYAKQFLPTERGFDSFYGFYNGALDYFNRSVTDRYSGFDLQRNGKPAPPRKGQYGTEVFTAEAERVIRRHNTSEPLFLYVAHQAAHSPLQAPKDWIEKFAHIEHEGRRTYAAMVAYLDYSVGRIYNALVQKKMSNDLLLVFTTDNGGPADGFDGNFASNYPLRGMKRTLWEEV